jgi:hypothetical protein
VEIEVEQGKDVKKMVKLDPEEHCAFVWATEEEVRMDRCGDMPLKWINNDEEKRDIILRGFQAMRAAKNEK